MCVYVCVCVWEGGCVWEGVCVSVCVYTCLKCAYNFAESNFKQIVERLLKVINYSYHNIARYLGNIYMYMSECV